MKNSMNHIQYNATFPNTCFTDVFLKLVESGSTQVIIFFILYISCFS